MKTAADIRRENVRRLAKKWGGNNAFAARIGRDASQVSRLIGDNASVNIGTRVARDIERSLNLPTGYLDSEHVEMSETAQPAAAQELDICDRPILELQRDIETGSAIFRVVGHQRVEAEQLEMVNVRPQDVCIIQTVDDGLGRSMGAGVRLAIDRSKPLADGKIYALRYGNLLRIRLVFQKPDGSLLLKALNPDYPEELISAQERAEMVEVIGLAFMALNVPL